MDNCQANDEIVAAYLLHQAFNGEELLWKMRECNISEEVMNLPFEELRMRLTDFMLK